MCCVWCVSVPPEVGCVRVWLCSVHNIHTLLVRSFLQKEVARLVFGHDCGTYRACFAGDDTTLACPVLVGNDSGIQRILKREITRAGNCWYKNQVATVLLGATGFFKLSSIRTDISCYAEGKIKDDTHFKYVHENV